MQDTGTRHVVLLGAMGSGKTTVGDRLAQRLRLPFIDSDRQLQRMVGMTGRAYVREHGVAALHEAEIEALMQALAGPPAVIAAAASVSDSAPALAALTASGARTVVLEAPPEVLAERIADGGHRRPVTAADLARLTAQRAARLEELRAIDVIDTSLVGVDQAVERLVARLAD